MKLPDGIKGVIGCIAILTVQIGVVLASVRWFEKQDRKQR